MRRPIALHLTVRRNAALLSFSPPGKHVRDRMAPLSPGARCGIVHSIAHACAINQKKANSVAASTSPAATLFAFFWLGNAHYWAYQRLSRRSRRSRPPLRPPPPPPPEL